MANVFIEARPKRRQEGDAIEDYAVEDHANSVLHTGKTQAEAIARAKAQGHHPLIARNDPPLQGGPIILKPEDHRRNLTVRGVPLNHLVGRRFRVGEVILRGGRLNFPCKYLEELLGMPLFLPLYNRSGLNCGIERGGIIRPGDAIELVS